MNATPIKIPRIDPCSQIEWRRHLALLCFLALIGANEATYQERAAVADRSQIELDPERRIMTVDRIRVMISSRCNDYVTADNARFPLASLRKSLQAEINTAGLFGKTFFECWINEVEPSKAATRDVWDECIREIRRAHIVIVLYNGDAGWARIATTAATISTPLARVCIGRAAAHLAGEAHI